MTLSKALILPEPIFLCWQVVAIGLALQGCNEDDSLCLKRAQDSAGCLGTHCAYLKKDEMKEFQCGNHSIYSKEEMAFAWGLHGGWSLPGFSMNKGRESAGWACSWCPLGQAEPLGRLCEVLGSLEEMGRQVPTGSIPWLVILLKIMSENLPDSVNVPYISLRRS